MTRDRVKQALGRVPAAAEIYQAWIADGKQPDGGYRLERLQAALPSWAEAARSYRSQEVATKVLVVGSLPWWIEYSAALASLFAARGCRVGLGYVPYRTWTDPVQEFDRRRQSVYLRDILAHASRVFEVHDLSAPARKGLDERLDKDIQLQSHSDVQYTLQREDVEGPEGDALYRLRVERNSAAAAAVTTALDKHRYEVVVIPNGSILEFGAAYAAARRFGATTVTYEFGEQRERMWLAQNMEVMRQDTSLLWEARGEAELLSAERQELVGMFAARRSGKSWKSFARQWQSAPSAGAQAVAQRLQLELERPVALLCTNVVGDSLALNRQVFTSGMAEWLRITVQHFNSQKDAQLVVRVHPGEMLGAGHPSADIVRSTLPELPSHVKLVGPESEINTYDLSELADLGLVYTSTVGLEMAMAGTPVIVAGDTHYRNRGFTSDPLTVDEYLELIDQALASSNERLSEREQELAERYAYQFFFEYPFRFPWHLIDFWQDVKARPVESVIVDSDAYRSTLDALLGEPIDWT